MHFRRDSLEGASLNHAIRRRHRGRIPSQDVDRPIEMAEVVHPTLGGGILLLDKDGLVGRNPTWPYRIGRNPTSPISGSSYNPSHNL